MNTSPTRRPTSLVMTTVVVLGLTLTACAGGLQPTLSVPDGAQSGDLLLEPCTFEIKESRYQADCGSLVVPENRNRADSRLIALPVTRVHASGSQPSEPIFFLDGGPGEALNTRYKPPAALLANHDFVMVGYRGVDGSSVLDCPEVSRAMQGVGGNLLSEASHANLSEARAQCAQRLQDAGIDLAGYTLPEVAADLEAARAGLGYERINLLARGYGTRIAQIDAYLYPDRVFRSALIGPGTPGRNMIFEPEIIDAQLETYARLCAEDATCRARTPDLTATMRNVFRNMPDRWLLFPIDTGKVKVGTPVPEEFRRVQPEDVQTLLVTGSIDARFPPDWVAEELLPQLTHAQQVVVAEAGHELLDVQPQAIERALTSFFDTGVADVSLYTYLPMDFQAPLSAPALAKIVLGVGVLIIALVAAITWRIIRRVRRRNLLVIA